MIDSSNRGLLSHRRQEVDSQPGDGDGVPLAGGGEAGTGFARCYYNLRAPGAYAIAWRGE